MSYNFHPQNPLCKKTEEMARSQGIMEKHMNDRNETSPESNRASVEKGMAYFMHAGPICVLGSVLTMFQISFRTCNHLAALISLCLGHVLNGLQGPYIGPNLSPLSFSSQYDLYIPYNRPIIVTMDQRKEYKDQTFSQPNSQLS